MLTLRPYQKKSIQKINRSLERVKSTLLVMATGGGKTAVFLSWLKDILEPNERALVIAHRQELIFQPVNRALDYYPRFGSSFGVVMGKYDECNSKVVVATIQTLASRKKENIYVVDDKTSSDNLLVAKQKKVSRRLQNILAHGQIDYVIVDEAHHAAAKSYMDVLDVLEQVNPDIKILGVTATPMRGDGDGLSKVFDDVADKVTIEDLIKLGYLAPVRWLAISTQIKVSSVEMRSDKKLASVFETDNCFELVVESHKKYAHDRPFIAFTVSVDGAYNLAEKFQDAGYRVEAADGTTPKEKRRQILDDFREGKLDGLCNVGLWTEGLDVPHISCVHQVRPTESDGLYIQMVGRALRTHPGKEDALILDYIPKTRRNISMMGDVLGVPLDKKHYTEETDEPGEVQAGFSFDGEYNLLSGDPMSIVAMELNYLQKSPFAWFRGDDGYSSLPLGKASDEIERTLVLECVGGEEYRLYLCAKRPDERNFLSYVVHDAGLNIDAIMEWSRNYADERGNFILAKRSASWRKQPASDAQVKFARRIGAYKKSVSKGELASRISHKLAVDSVQTRLQF